MDIFLRNLSLNDAKDFFYAAWDENVWRFIPGFYCDTTDKAREIIKTLLSDPPTVTAYVIASEEISFIGIIVVVEKGVQEGKNAYELSYFIDEKFRRKGFATKAVKKILQEYKNCRIYLDILQCNKPSLAIAKQFKAFKAPEIDDLYFIDT